MKKTLALLLAAATLLLSSCAVTYPYEREEGDSDAAVKIMKEIKPEDRYCASYDFEKYVLNSLFEGKIEYHESIMPVRNQDGTLDPIPLLYKAEKIISVQDAKLEKTYEAGKDFILEDGKIVIPQGSDIFVTDYDYYYPPEPIPNHTFACGKGGNIRLFYAPDAHLRQTVVTYIHEDEYAGPVPAKKGNKLPKFWQKLKSGETVKMVWYGDSITAGGDSSSLYNVPPKMPIYPILVTKAIHTLFDYAHIDYTNTSLGGMTILWGLENVEEKVNAHKPDLVVLAWGMNSAGLNAAAYYEKTKELMGKISEKNPDCEFVIIVPMLPNDEAIPFRADITNYRYEIEKLEKEGVVMANMTEIHEYLLTKKRFYDMTGNNINHCNDYLTRWYAQTVLRTILEP